MEDNDVIIIGESVKEEVTTKTFDRYEEPTNKRTCKRYKSRIQFAMVDIAAKLKAVEELEKRLLNQVNDRSNSVNIEKPTFSTTHLIHPLNFIENLISFLGKLPEQNQTIETILDCLQGDALNWATILKPRWSNIEDFTKDFIDHYWGREEQSLLKKQILNGKWNWKDETMWRHFTCLISQAKWLTNKMADDELIYEIMQHYPKQVQIAWFVSNKKSVLEATEFLKKMDEIETNCQGRKRTRQMNSMKTKYFVREENVNQCPDIKKIQPQQQ